MADENPTRSPPARQLPISNGGFTLVDDFWYWWLSAMRWKAEIKPDGRIYVRRNLRERDGSISPIQLHRLVMGAESGEIIDHRNGDTLDNRTENLRFCTQRQNMQNSKRGKRNTSGYKGVWKYSDAKRKKMWAVRIRDQDGKQVFVGSFETAEEAALAYNEAALRFHGEFAWLNEIAA
jgi:hypothetical protein